MRLAPARIEPSIFRLIALKLATTPPGPVLEHMLLHESYINMAIANILMYSKSLYDLPRLVGQNTKNVTNANG